MPTEPCRSSVPSRSPRRWKPIIGQPIICATSNLGWRPFLGNTANRACLQPTRIVPSNGASFFDGVLFQHRNSGRGLIQWGRCILTQNPASVAPLPAGVYSPPPRVYEPGLASVVDRCLQKDASRRPTVTEVLQAPVLKARLNQWLTFQCHDASVPVSYLNRIAELRSAFEQ